MSESKDAKEANASLMELITHDFCNWLFQKKMTSIKVELSRDIEIDFQPPISKLKSTPGKAESAK